MDSAIWAYSFGTLFFACETGQRLTNGFDEINELFNRLDRYRFPDEIKRMPTTILINSHEPVELLYFGSHSCSRETMEEVSNWESSAGNILRRPQKQFYADINYSYSIFQCTFLYLSVCTK